MSIAPFRDSHVAPLRYTWRDHGDALMKSGSTLPGCGPLHFRNFPTMAVALRWTCAFAFKDRSPPMATACLMAHTPLRTVTNPQ